MHIHQNLFAGGEGTVILHLHLHCGSHTGAGFQAIGNKAHSLVHNSGAHAAVECAGAVTHPLEGAAPHMQRPTVGGGGEDLIVHLIPGGAGCDLMQFPDPIPDDLSKIIHPGHR